jgi:hypothetical protein
VIFWDCCRAEALPSPSSLAFQPSSEINFGDLDIFESSNRSDKDQEPVQIPLPLEGAGLGLSAGQIQMGVRDEIAASELIFSHTHFKSYLAEVKPHPQHFFQSEKGVNRDITLMLHQMEASLRKKRAKLAGINLQLLSNSSPMLESVRCEELTPTEARQWRCCRLSF